jgi:hypothetical protein
MRTGCGRAVAGGQLDAKLCTEEEKQDMGQSARLTVPRSHFIDKRADSVRGVLSVALKEIGQDVGVCLPEETIWLIETMRAARSRTACSQISGQPTVCVW